MAQGSRLLSFLKCVICCLVRIIYTTGDLSQPSESCTYEFKNQSFGVLAIPTDELSGNKSKYCSWDIEVQEGFRIAISIRSLFLAAGETLSITEYKTIANSSLLHRKVFDKDNRPEDVIFSSSNKVKVEINRVDGIGYFSPSEELLNSSIRRFYAIFEIENCGGILASDMGVIEIPAYVHLSMKSHECTWRIVAPEDKVISLSFLSFQVGPGSCLFNMLYIRDGLTSLSDLIGSYCEEYPPLHTIRSSSNGLTVTYRTRPTFLATKVDMIPRIKMRYEFRENCGGILDSFSGSFTSPSAAPLPEAPCIWLIKVPESNHALLTVKSYQMNIVNETGLQERLNIFDGVTQNNTLIWSSSWLKPPPPSLFSSNRDIAVNYSTDKDTNKTVRLKFKISFRAVHERISNPDRCKSVGNSRLFQCDENQYVYCHLVCNGVHECENGLDEDQCIVHYSQIDARENGNKVEVGYLIVSFALFGSAILACMLVVAIDRLCRSRISTLIKEETGNGEHTSNRRRAPAHSPSLLPSYSDIDIDVPVDAPPCYEEAVADYSNVPLSEDVGFDIVTGRGHCQSPLSPLSEASIMIQDTPLTGHTNDDNPER